MKRLYLHIGTEKTGTTSLQNFLLANENALNEVGFSYLCGDDKPYFYQLTHLPLIASLLGVKNSHFPEQRHPAETILQCLKDDLAASDKDIILSSEEFSTRIHDKQSLAKLREVAGEREVYIVCYIRPQDELAISSYSTNVLYGRTAPFSSDDVVFENRYFNYAALLGPWASMFGSDRLIVRNYQRSALVKGDICQDFLGVLGIEDMTAFAPVCEWNASLDVRQVEVLRLFNMYMPPTSSPSAYKEAQNMRLCLSRYLPRGEPLQQILSTEERKAILAEFVEANREVERRYMTPGALAGWNGESVLGLPSQPLHPVDMNDLCETIKLLTEKLMALENSKE